MIDTHEHYGAALFRGSLKEVRDLDLAAGIRESLCLPVSYEDNFSMIEKAGEYAGIPLLFSVGIHPLRVGSPAPVSEEDPDLDRDLVCLRERIRFLEDFRDRMQALDRMIVENSDRIAAVGETGIDTHTEAGAASLRMQKISLREHIFLSQRHRLPLVLHLRGKDALDEALSVMNRGKLKHIRYRGVWHCFHGTAEDMARISDDGKNDFVFGIGGILTYPERGAQLRETLKTLAGREDILSKLVLETDAPYLAPLPVQEKEGTGKAVNMSAYLPLVTKELAGVLDVSEEEVIRRTSENAVRMFGFSPDGQGRA